MLQPLRFVMHLVPFHAEDFVQHAFDEVVADGCATCNLAPGRCELDAAVVADRNQTIAFEAPQCHSNRRRGNREPVRQARRDDLFALALRLKDGLEIVLFGNRNHER